MDDLGDYASDAMADFLRETDCLDAEATRALFETGGGAYRWNLLNLALWWGAYVK